VRPLARPTDNSDAQSRITPVLYRLSIGHHLVFTAHLRLQKLLCGWDTPPRGERIEGLL
jgi:hypothetical protein